MILRALDIKTIAAQKSCFLWGPRQTGKTSLLKQQLPNSSRIDLLKSDVFRDFSVRPERLREFCAMTKGPVIIDEIQRIPELLNEVHFLIEEQGIRFVMTGSSALKLRKKGVNLLGGRARSRVLHPFTADELGNEFDLGKALQFGLLPSIWFSGEPMEDLKAYAGDYLETEIAAEGITRNIPAFSRFLETAALCNGQMLNYTAIANDAQVKLGTVRNYFEILNETLIASTLPAYGETSKRKAIKAPKFYFFDIGVVNSLIGRSSLSRGTPEYGQAFEAWVHHELKARIDRKGSGHLSYWRSTSGFEVDFILNDSIAIEVKAKRTLSNDDLKGMRALAEEKKTRRMIIISLERESRKVGKIEVIPYERFIQEADSFF